MFSQCIVIEDALAGVQAAKAAQMRYALNSVPGIEENDL